MALIARLYSRLHWPWNSPPGYEEEDKWRKFIADERQRTHLSINDRYSLLAGAGPISGFSIGKPTVVVPNFNAEQHLEELARNPPLPPLVDLSPNGWWQQDYFKRYSQIEAWQDKRTKHRLDVEWDLAEPHPLPKKDDKVERMPGLFHRYPSGTGMDRDEFPYDMAQHAQAEFEQAKRELQATQCAYQEAQRRLQYAKIHFPRSVQFIKQLTFNLKSARYQYQRAQQTLSAAQEDIAILQSKPKKFVLPNNATTRRLIASGPTNAAVAEQRTTPSIQSVQGNSAKGKQPVGSSYKDDPVLSTVVQQAMESAKKTPLRQVLDNTGVKRTKHVAFNSVAEVFRLPPDVLENLPEAQSPQTPPDWDEGPYMSGAILNDQVEMRDRPATVVLWDGKDPRKTPDIASSPDAMEVLRRIVQKDDVARLGSVARHDSGCVMS